MGSVFAIVAYIVFPITPGDLESVRLNNTLLGLGITLALLGIGFGVVHWSKTLMDGHDLVETASSDPRERGDPRTRRGDLHTSATRSRASRAAR